VVNMRREEFKQRFPHLAEELDSDNMKLQIESVRTVPEEADKAASNLSAYIPTAIDYLRRCDNEMDAFDTISYLESKREITTQYAAKLKAQLKRHGLGSFGARKKDDHYQRKTART